MVAQAEDGEILAKDYQRVSKDRSGRERSPEEQGEDNRAKWAEFRFVGSYRDTVSASKYATKPRDDFPRLLTDLHEDRFGAQVLVLWTSTRGSRRVGEWVDLLEAAELRKVRIAVTEHDRVYLPWNWRDRRTLLEDAVDGEAQVGQMSGAIRRAVAANAADGRPHGRCPWGYSRVYDPKTGAMIRQELHPDEAPVVQELFERLQRGHTLRAIARDLEQRGTRTRTGKTFTTEHLRTMAINPLYIAKRLHRPGRKNRVTASIHMFDDDVTVADAAWPPIVSESTFWAVQQVLGQPERRTVRPGSGVHLLTYLGSCDQCGGPLSMLHPDGERRYRCHKRGCVQCSADDLDALVEEVVISYLSREDVYELVVGDDGDDAELEAVRADAAKIRHALRELAEQLGKREISPKLAGQTEAVYEADLAHLEARELELTTPSQLAGIIGPGEDVRERWKDLPMSAKRQVIKLVTVPDLLGELRITKAARRGMPVDERVRWARNES